MWALVLAGGASRRMGRPKGELAFAGGTLLTRVVAAARQVADQVILVGAGEAAARLGLRAVDDLERGAGPLSGLAGGLTVCPAGYHALLACDMPFLEPDLLRRMEQLAGGADAVVPRTEAGIHPLCALYRRECLDPARACLAEGQRRMEDLLRRVRVRTVGPDEVHPARLARAVMNVNTPEDYRLALQAWEDRGDGP